MTIYRQLKVDQEFYQQYQLEVDYHILLAVNTLINRLIEDFCDFNKIKSHEQIQDLTKVSEMVDPKLKQVKNSWPFILGDKLLIERLKVMDYPKDGLGFLLNHNEEIFSTTYSKYTEAQVKQPPNKIIDVSKAIGGIYLSIRMLSDLKIIEKKPLIRRKELYKSIEEQIKDIHSVFPYLDKRLYEIYENLYPDMIDLFHYKIIYLYFQQVVSRSQIEDVNNVVLEDAYLTFKEKVVGYLGKVNANDLWFLGNHEFEKLFKKWDITGKLQHTILSNPLEKAQKNRNKVIEEVLDNRYLEMILLVEGLRSNQDFITRFIQSQPEFKLMFKPLDECVVELFKFYEEYEIESLVDMGLLDSLKQVQPFFKKFNIDYDSLRVGTLLDPESCITLEIEKTNDPALDNEVKVIHEQGIIHRNHHIRKNLVTVFVLDVERFS